MFFREKGNTSFGTMTILVGGAALAGLLFYGWQSRQTLPLWPALAVVTVNILAAAKIIQTIRRAKKDGGTPETMPDSVPARAKQARNP